jgi:hypothetical protein
MVTTSVDPVGSRDIAFCDRKVEYIVLKSVKLSLIVNYNFLVSRSRLIGFIIHTRPIWNLFVKEFPYAVEANNLY